MGSMRMGRGAWVMGQPHDLTDQTETGSQFLLHNRSSEEDAVQGGRWPHCNVSSRRSCTMQQHRMTRQHLAVPATSASPERLFSSVGLVKSDLRGSLLDTTLIDVMWAKQAP